MLCAVLTRESGAKHYLSTNSNPSCGSINEFEDPRIEKLQDQIALKYGFELTSHKHEMYGICAACIAKRS